MGGELEPGTIHSTTAFAERLGISTTPVREAMLELARHGLLEPLRNRGFRIAAAGDGELEEIRNLRLMLEVPAMALVIERARNVDLEALRPWISELDSAARRGDVRNFLIADRAFHLGLLELSENARLVRIVGELRDQTGIEVGLRPLISSGALQGAGPEHDAILDAVLARDISSAQRCVTEHLHPPAECCPD